MGTTGMRRFVPAASRIHKAKLGLRRAAEQDGVFHLWTHPFNLSSDRAYMLSVLEGILQAASNARDRDHPIAPMGAVPDLFGADPEGSRSTGWHRRRPQPGLRYGAGRNRDRRGGGRRGRTGRSGHGAASDPVHLLEPRPGGSLASCSPAMTMSNVRGTMSASKDALRQPVR
jgi:hypothetical protein